MYGTLGKTTFVIEFNYPEKHENKKREAAVKLLKESGLDLRIKIKYLPLTTTKCKIYYLEGQDSKGIPFKKSTVEGAIANNNILEGISKCAHGDTFLKENGRKYALAYALENSNFTKNERTIIWETYINRKNLV